MVAYSLDRISREKHFEFYGYENTLNKNGVRIEYATQVFEAGFGGNVLKSVHVSMATEYINQLRNNVVRGMRDNAMKGNYNGGSAVPIGIKIVERGKNNKCYEPDEETAPLIEQAFKLYVMGKSTKDVADFLNNNGVRNSRGNIITRDTVNRMLANPLYKGTKITTFDNEIEHKVYTVEGICTPIVSEDLWERAQIVRENKKYRGARSDARIEYILRGKIYCGICGTEMIANSGKSKNGEMYYYYACRNFKNKKGKEKCPKKNVSKTVIENAVMKIINNYVWDEAKIAEIIAASKIAELNKTENPRISQLEASIKKHRERKQRASERYLNTGDKIWAEHVEEEEALIQADEKELAAVNRHQQNWKTTEELCDEIKEMRMCWERMQRSDDGRKQIIDNYIERIVVYDEEPDDPGKIKIDVTIRTDPLGEFAADVNATIELGVSGLEHMVHHESPFSNGDFFIS